MELLPGAAVAISVMPPMPTVWWLRPVNRAARVGEQSAVVWKRVYLKPSVARASATGVFMGPPNALEAPKPTSSSSTNRMFGAFLGGRIGVMGGNLASTLLASYTINPV